MSPRPRLPNHWLYLSHPFHGMTPLQFDTIVYASLICSFFSSSIKFKIIKLLSIRDSNWIHATTFTFLELDHIITGIRKSDRIPPAMDSVA
jgi:hypothetical protein